MPVWTKQGIVITPNTHDLNGGVDTSGTQEPTVLYEANPVQISANADGKVFKIWFTGGPDICYAESNDGITWTRWTGATNAVVLAAHTHSRLTKISSTYYLYACPGVLFGSINCYTSSDGVTFSLAKTGALTAGAGGSYDAALCQLRPTVNNAGTWTATYSCSVTAGGTWGTALATSTDLLNWTKAGAQDIANYANLDIHNVGGTYYGWGQNTYGPNATPTDVFRVQFTSSALTAITGACEALPRTGATEGFNSANGQTADPSYVEVNNQVYCYYTATATGNLGTGYTLQCAIANMPFTTLVTTTEGIIASSLLFVQKLDCVFSSSAQFIAGVYAGRTHGNSLLIAQCLYFNASGSPAFVSLTDTLGNTWTQIGTWQGNPVGEGAWSLFYCKNKSAGGANTVTLTCSGVSYIELSLLEYLQQADSPVDVHAQLGPHSTSTSIVTPNVVTTLPNETVVACARVGVNEASCSVGAPFTQRIAMSTVNKFHGAADAAEATTGTYAATFTVATTSTYHAGTVGFLSGLSSPTFEITGNAGVASATISWTGTASGSTTADSLGDYNTGALGAGSYTLTPSLAGYTFSPTNSAQTITTADITGVNFTATQAPVATPTFSPVAGSYGPTQTVTVSCTDSGLTGFAMYYTTDGSTPTTGSTPYTVPISVATTQTVKVLATATGRTNSTVGSAAYTINGAVATPTFSPVAGSYSGTQTVTISSATGGSSLFYTTDGSTPTSGSTPYTTPVSVASSLTLKAIGTKTNFSDSAVGSAAYTIGAAAGAGQVSVIMLS